MSGYFDKRSDKAADTDDTPAALLEQLVFVDNFLQGNNDSLSDSPNFEEQLSTELAAFADDEFIFPDEDKPKKKDGDTNGNGDDDGWEFRESNHASLSNDLTGHGLNNGGVDAGDVSTTAAAGATDGFQYNQAPSPIPSTIYELLGRRNSNGTTGMVAPNLGGSSDGPASVEQVQQLLPRVQVPQGAQSTLTAAGLSQTQIEALATLILYHKTELLNTTSGAAGSTLPAATTFSATTSTTAPTTTTSSSVNLDLVRAGSTLDASAAGNSPAHVASPLSRHAELLAQTLLTSAPQEVPAYYESGAQGFNSLPNLNSSETPSPARSSPSGPPSSRKRRASPAGSTPSDQADNERDKRRRNTAASARFRIKKKMKEQEMEQSLKELNDVSKTLEGKVRHLEMENQLLKNLVIEKNQRRDTEEVEKLKKRAKMTVHGDEKR